ncbi:hypothetical protein [Nesterenkonia flava]|uniref:STAS domain-containing protein n=1 Tax=Nesterenkonia flava TaxID=469799 RepID=A0ABU1FT45_9MICC|nr:hypothetical protein [Nesterenkonia flava]MDR5711497.1 hypothetical protein [Nesterenkonia flava]
MNLNHIPRCDIVIEQSTASLHLVVSGCFTIEGCGQLTDILQSNLLVQTASEVLIDLREVEHLEPVALAALELHLLQHDSSESSLRVGVETPDFPMSCEEAASGPLSEV